MAALPDKEEGAVDADEIVKEESEGKATEVKGRLPQIETGKDVKGGQTKGADKGGGGGKKKKGKR